MRSHRFAKATAAASVLADPPIDELNPARVSIGLAVIQLPHDAVLHQPQTITKMPADITLRLINTNTALPKNVSIVRSSIEGALPKTSALGRYGLTYAFSDGGV